MVAGWLIWSLMSYERLNYDRLHIHKGLGNFQKSDSNNKTTTRPFVACEDPFHDQKTVWLGYFLL